MKRCVLTASWGCRVYDPSQLEMITKQPAECFFHCWSSGARKKPAGSRGGEDRNNWIIQAWEKLLPSQICYKGLSPVRAEISAWKLHLLLSLVSTTPGYWYATARREKKRVRSDGKSQTHVLKKQNYDENYDYFKLHPNLRSIIGFPCTLSSHCALYEFCLLILAAESLIQTRDEQPISRTD